MAGFGLSSSSAFSRNEARQKYQKLEKKGAVRRRSKVLQLGAPKKRKFVCKIRIAPKLSLLRSLSPKKLLVRIRDAYINMMMGVASKGGISMLGVAKDRAAFAAHNELRYGELQRVYWNYLRRSVREGRLVINLDEFQMKQD